MLRHGYRRLVEKVFFGRHPLAAPLRKAAHLLIGGQREVTFRFRSGPAKGMRFSCLSSHKYFFVRDGYEHELIEPLEQMIRPGMTVFDIGAHFGFWALALSRLCGSSGQVFAFEPIGENRTRLARNLDMNSITNVKIVPLVVSNTAGTIRMSNEGSMSALEHGDLSVESTTIDLFCQQNADPDFVLIDVEGFAGYVLRGATATYARKFIPTICEIHNAREQEEFEKFMDGRTIRQLDKRRRYAHRVIATD